MSKLVSIIAFIGAVVCVFLAGYGFDHGAGRGMMTAYVISAIALAFVAMVIGVEIE